MRKQGPDLDYSDFELKDDQPRILYTKIDKWYRRYKSQCEGQREHALTLFLGQWPKIERRAQALELFKQSPPEAISLGESLLTVMEPIDLIPQDQSEAAVPFNPSHFYLVLLWYVSFSPVNKKQLSKFISETQGFISSSVKFYTESNGWRFRVHEYVPQLLKLFDPCAFAPLQISSDFVVPSPVSASAQKTACARGPDRRLQWLIIALIVVSITGLVVGSLALAVTLATTASSLTQTLAPLAALGFAGGVSLVAVGGVGLVGGLGFFAYQASTSAVTPQLPADAVLLIPSKQ